MKNDVMSGLSRRGNAPEDEPENDLNDYFEAKLYNIITNATNHYLVHIQLNEADILAMISCLAAIWRFLNDHLMSPTKNIKNSRRNRVASLHDMDHPLHEIKREECLLDERFPEQWQEFIQPLHNEVCRSSSEECNVSCRYQWKGFYEDVCKFWRTGERCQRKAR
jgi:hypothetical protein